MVEIETINEQECIAAQGILIICTNSLVSIPAVGIYHHPAPSCSLWQRVERLLKIRIRPEQGIVDCLQNFKYGGSGVDFNGPVQLRYDGSER